MNRLQTIAAIVALLLPALQCPADNRMSDPIPGDPYGADNPAGESIAERAKSGVHAVMYEFTYDTTTLAITHAQVVGGYPSVDECREQMPRVMATGEPQVGEGEQMQLQCSGIKEPTEAPADAGDEQAHKPKTII